MEFLGIGYQEILLVLVLMLVVVGPERMPSVAYQIGKAVRTLQKYARAVRDEFSEEFEYIDEQYRGLRGEIETASAGLREEQNRLQAELESSRASLESEVNAPLRDASAAVQVHGKTAGGLADGAGQLSASGQPATAEPGEAAATGNQGSGGPPLVF